MDNARFADIFEEIAQLLQIRGDNPFRVRAYKNAAEVIAALPHSLETLTKEGAARLVEIPGIGKDLAAKIIELDETGRLVFLDDLRKEVPPSLLEILEISGVGPKRVHELWQELDVVDLDQLEAAIEEGRVDKLKGFGPTLKKKILAGIPRVRARRGRFGIADVDPVADAYIRYLKKSKNLVHLEYAGSLRRRKETIGDLDILATTTTESNVMERFVEYEQVDEILAAGKTKSSVRLHSGLQVDLRLVDEECYGAALHYFTGSQAHNVTIRGIARKKELKISEYGVFRGTKRVAGRTEEEVYAAVGMTWVHPELRENRGEIEAALDDSLPDLVELKHIRGDLQMHTTASDGRNSLREMVQAAVAKKYKYMAITDHSPSVQVAGGMDARGFRKQFRQIDKLQDEFPQIRIFKSAEVDILPDGSLDLPDDLLSEMDLVLVSIHSHFEMSKAEMTARLVTALQHPSVRILGHPTGRKVNEREGYPLDLERVLETARDEGVLVEHTAHPKRLDLRDHQLQLAKELGVKIVISTDAHCVDGLDLMRFGVDQARRGWLTRTDVANTGTLRAFEKLLNPR